MLDPTQLEGYLRSVPSYHSVIRYDRRPWTLNAERRMHYMERARNAREWREAFAWLARANRVPLFHRAVVIVQPHSSRGPLQDCDACHPAAKAAIDGLVDAGVLISDGPLHITEIRYLVALPDASDGLSIIVCNRQPQQSEEA
jgi:hypothetical protein